MRAFDFFAGCGGASLGLAAAGVEVLLAFERDPDACASHRGDDPGRVLEVDVRAPWVFRPWLLAPLEPVPSWRKGPDSGYVGTKSSQYRQVGNACPPPLISAVVRSIIDADT